MIYAFLPFVTRNPVEGVTRPIIELGFWMIQVLKMNGWFCAIFQIILMFPNVN